MSATHAILGGRYRLGELLGQGGMGRVWAAHDEVLDRSVAVKEVLLPRGLTDDERDTMLARTLREARAAARVPHPHVVHVHDVVEDGGRPWVVLQLLAPRTLADVIAEEGPVSPARAARIGLELLDGLSAVHAAGVVHRDVKPGNVLFDADGGAVLSDFGIASLDGDPAVTSTGLLLGSPAYLAPERARGGGPSPAADLWSLGATLHAAVEGLAPFHRDGPLPTLGALLTEDVPAAPSAGPLAPALAALLVKDPAARADATRARSLLEAALRAPAQVVPAVAAPPAETPSADTQAMALPPDFPRQADETAAPAVPGTRPASAPVPVHSSAVPPPRRRAAALVAAGVVAVAALPLAAIGLRTAPTPQHASVSAAAALPRPLPAPAHKATTRPAVKATSRPAARPTTAAASPVGGSPVGGGPVGGGPVSGSAAAAGTRAGTAEDRAGTGEGRADTKDHRGAKKVERWTRANGRKAGRGGGGGKDHWIGPDTLAPALVTLPQHAGDLPPVPQG